MNKIYKGFLFKYRRGNAEREGDYAIFHNNSLVAAGLENQKECRKWVDENESKTEFIALRKFLYGVSLPKKKKAGRKK